MQIINLFKRPAIATGVVLLIPFLASEMAIINWDLADFIVMGTMLFGTGLILELVVRKATNKTHRVALVIAALLGFLWLWAELAVGVFTNWGS